MIKKKPLVSVVIPTYNEEKDIEECLNSLEKQSYKNFEIIVVDDGSIDRTKDKIKKFNVKLIENKHRGPGLSRNLGAKKAEGKIIVFVDSDMSFHKNYLKNLINPLKNKKVIGTTHELEIVKNTDNIWSMCWGKYRVSKENAETVKIFRAIRKNKFLEMGGFDSKYGYADDQTFWFKYRIKPDVARNTVCFHKNPETLSEVFRQSRWIGSSTSLKWIDVSVANFFYALLLYIFSILIIPVLSIRQVYKIRRVDLLFPWMFVFMTARYFGTLAGYLRRIFWDVNVR